MATFYLIRHGKHSYESISGKSFIGHGLELAPLTDEGVNQAIECSRDTRLKDCQLILSSPYTRAMQTSAILSKILNIDIRVEIDLREHELDLTYQTKSFDELKQIASEEQTSYGQASYNECNKWEHRDNVKIRVGNILKKYREYKKIIVVSHGMVIHCLTGKIGIQNCSINEYVMD